MPSNVPSCALGLADLPGDEEGLQEQQEGEALGSWLSSAFKKVTGVRLSAVAGPLAAVASAPVLGPVGSMLVGAGVQATSNRSATVVPPVGVSGTQAPASQPTPAPVVLYANGQATGGGVDPFIYDQLSRKDTPVKQEVTWKTVATIGFAAAAVAVVIKNRKRGGK